MTGEELDADLIAEEILMKFHMSFPQDDLSALTEDGLKITIRNVLVSYGATSEQNKTPNPGTTGS